jgi:hypothetical protein
MGAKLAVSTKFNAAQSGCPSAICINRDIVERLWITLKEW